MLTAIQVIWWIAIAIALIATLVVLKQVSMILGELKRIHRLGVVTLEAARGMASNLETVPSLQPLDEPANELRGAASHLRTAVESMETKIAGISRGRPQ